VLVVIGLALILGTLKLLRDRNRIAQETKRPARQTRSLLGP
jgi:hypothetical protein